MSKEVSVVEIGKDVICLTITVKQHIRALKGKVRFSGRAVSKILGE